MSQSRGLLSILCLILAYSWAQAWNFGIDTGERVFQKIEFPVHVTVSEKCGPSLGGGSLISNYVVLTAWKVVENRNASEIKVLIYQLDDSFDEYGPERELGVKSVVRHPNFSEKSGAYNLALLFLKKPIEISSTIAPIKLATPTSIRNLDLTSCVAKGTGLKTLPLPVLPTATCERELRRWLGASFLLDASLLCAGGGVGRNICDEDGYPLVCPLARDPTKFEQVGIVNWHINCGQDATPDVYTKVARFSGWINQQISLNPYVEEPADENNGEETECSTYDNDFDQGTLEEPGTWGLPGYEGGPGNLGFSEYMEPLGPVPEASETEGAPPKAPKFEGSQPEASETVGVAPRHR